MYRLFETMNRLLSNVTSDFLRYEYGNINWENRMLGLVGPRGVGKTTLFLQHIKRTIDECQPLYFSADDMYFADHTLFETADKFYKQGGTHLYIDEVHKYQPWSQELKAIYDSFPNMHVYFTGSSILDIEKGEADLSRRAPKYTLQGLSFREFLALRYAVKMEPIGLPDILTNRIEIPGVGHPLPLFKEYLENGYYPFGIDPGFQIELIQVINRTLEVDVPQFANMNTATGRKLKILLAIIGDSVPFKPNMTKLASQIGASRNNLEDYLLYIEKAGLIMQLRNNTGGISALGKAKKIYLDNTNLMFSLNESEPDKGTLRETFFLNQMRVNNSVTVSSSSDFSIGKMTFEVGGKGKTGHQVKDISNSYIVKDDIEYGHGNVIPLWAFGLNY